MLKRFVGYENMHSNSPLRDKQTLEIIWKSTGYFFHNKLLKKANFPINKCYGRSDDLDDDYDDKMVNPFSRKL